MPSSSLNEGLALFALDVQAVVAALQAINAQVARHGCHQRRHVLQRSACTSRVKGASGQEAS